MLKRFSLLLITASFIGVNCFAQHSDESRNILMLRNYEDTLTSLGKQFVNDTIEKNRKDANYAFIKVLVSALKVPNSFLYPFDSVKSVGIINSPDNRFRIISWPILADDGTYRFYGAIQLNTGGNLRMFPLSDYSPNLKNPEDSVTDNRKWFGAEYYRIIPVYSPKLYYILLGWKGYTARSTKKVIDVLSFVNDKPVFGMAVFDEKGKTHERVVFQYTRQSSMLLRYVPDQNLIVFDHLSPPDQKEKTQLDTYGPDLSYDGYREKNGKWVYVEDLDMRNIPDNHDAQYIDPKKQGEIDKATAPPKQQ